MPQKDKKLKTNQMMKVQIGNFGIIEIGHKTEMGKVSQIIEMGNANREAKGLESIRLDRILEKQEFWEFVIARNTQIIKSRESRDLANSDYSDIFKSLNLRELKNFTNFDKKKDILLLLILKNLKNIKI